MRFGGSGALRCVKSEERTPLQRVTANKCDGQFAPSAKSGNSFNQVRSSPKVYQIN